MHPPVYNFIKKTLYSISSGYQVRGISSRYQFGVSTEQLTLCTERRKGTCIKWTKFGPIWFCITYAFRLADKGNYKVYTVSQVMGENLSGLNIQRVLKIDVQKWSNFDDCGLKVIIRKADK